MTRIEIMMDNTIDDIFMEHLHRDMGNKAYTLVREAFGNGESGPRMGTAVWPERTSIFILYTGDEEVEGIRTIIAEMRKAHPNNGITAFVLPEARELFSSDE